MNQSLTCRWKGPNGGTKRVTNLTEHRRAATRNEQLLLSAMRFYFFRAHQGPKSMQRVALDACFLRAVKGLPQNARFCLVESFPSPPIKRSSWCLRQHTDMSPSARKWKFCPIDPRFNAERVPRVTICSRMHLVRHFSLFTDQPPHRRNTHHQIRPFTKRSTSGRRKNQACRVRRGTTYLHPIKQCTGTSLQSAVIRSRSYFLV